MWSALLLLGLSAEEAQAKKGLDDVGTRIYVRVIDPEGEPVSSAIIRHPDETDRHRVNSVDGTWDEELLYMPDGSELIFEPGLLLYLEVSAPGYQSQIVQYQVRRRSNRFDVVLQPQEVTLPPEAELPPIDFHRDKPRD